MIQTSKTEGITRSDRLIKFARAIAKAQGLDFDLKSDIVYNQQDFMDKLKFNENRVIIFDECNPTQFKGD